MNWQPIETVPNDGYPVLVGFHHPQFGWQVLATPAYGENTAKEAYFNTPTHWAPLEVPDFSWQKSSILGIRPEDISKVTASMVQIVKGF